MDWAAFQVYPEDRLWRNPVMVDEKAIGKCVE
jgi:hypothetical protein